MLKAWDFKPGELVGWIDANSNLRFGMVVVDDNYSLKDQNRVVIRDNLGNRCCPTANRVGRIEE